MWRLQSHRITVGNVTLKLYRDSDTKEFAVRWYENGKWDEAKTYFASDMSDALLTMDAEARRLQS